MSISLSSADLTRRADAPSTLLSPLEHATRDACRAGVVRMLLGS